MYTFVISPDEPCGCERGLIGRDCCIRDGRVSFTPAKIFPRPPQTGETVRRCYLAHTNDCGDGLSHEHLISRAVLAQIAEPSLILVGGGIEREFSIDSPGLTTKCLCKRHNTALSPLDAQAARLFRAVIQFHEALSAGTREPRFRLFGGFDIERWLAKTAIALFHGRLCGAGPTTNLPPSAYDALHQALQPPFGLYVPVARQDGERAVALVARQATGRLFYQGSDVVGVSITLAGIELVLAFESSEAMLNGLKSTHAYRPQNLNFFNGIDVRSVAFAWPAFWKGGTIWFSRDGADQRIPSN